MYKYKIQPLYYFTILIFFLSCSASKKSGEIPGWKLEWADEFNYEGLPNNKLWSYDVGGNGWGNNEKQFYLFESLENSYVKDGKLHIKAIKKKHDKNDYTSAKLITYGKNSLQYGKIEVRAKLPKGKGSWPAIWMLPESIKNGSENWPLCGEIDIMEHVGKDANTIHTSLHSELYNHIKNTQVTYFSKVDNVAEQFHTYGIEWNENQISFFIDQKQFFTSKKGENNKISTNEGWPFNKPYYLILNVAVGGNWGGEVDDNSLPMVMEVDYVRVYKKK